MFQKKDIIFSDAIGVCRVADIAKLGLKNEETTQYYVLRSVHNSKKVSYIPVEHHEVTLRHLITREEALALSENGEEKNELLQEEIRFVLEHTAEPI